MKPVVFIDLPCNPLSVNVVNDGGENGNGVSDRGHFLTAKQISFNGILVFMFSCGVWVCGTQSTSGPICLKTVFKMLIDQSA